ncbi:MAG: TadE family protein [Pseudomonadota bacterium]
MDKRFFSRWLDDERGSITIDFTLLLVPVMALVLLVCEIGIAFHIASSSQKAAQLAARLAAVREPVHDGVWIRNRLDPLSGWRAGDACYQDSSYGDACIDPGIDWVCDGSALTAQCDVADFNRIVDELRRTYPTVNSQDITITYVYRKLGVAEGLFVPEVAVTIAKRPMPISLLTSVGLLELREVTASMLGEDMLNS